MLFLGGHEGMLECVAATHILTADQVLTLYNCPLIFDQQL